MDTESQDIKREVSDYSPSRFIPVRLLDSGLGTFEQMQLIEGVGGWGGMISKWGKTPYKSTELKAAKLAIATFIKAKGGVEIYVRMNNMLVLSCLMDMDQIKNQKLVSTKNVNSDYFLS